MSKHIDLVNGPVLSSLTRLALPIMATSLIQMAYNLTDMLWIGRLGSDAVASVGAAGMYMWLSNGLAALPKMGGQVCAGHALGAGRPKEAASFASAALWMTAALGLLYGLCCILFADPLIGFFNLNSAQVIADAKIYLQITCGLVVFSFINQAFTGLFTAAGNSRNSFAATLSGLVINMVLDPVLIFGLGPFPVMGVMGAAIATIFAQFIVTVVFVFYAGRDTVLFRHMEIRRRPGREQLNRILRIGFPTCVQNMLFTGISMIIARLVAGYGDAAVAVQKVGSQIESISWMTAEGFAAAVNSFLAQNSGAGKPQRLPQRHGRGAHLGRLLHRASDRFSGTHLPPVYLRGGRDPHGRGLPGHPGRVPASHECGDHHGRGVCRHGQDAPALHLQHCPYRRPDPHGCHPGEDAASPERHLVEHHDLQHLQGDRPVPLVPPVSWGRAQPDGEVCSALKM